MSKDSPCMESGSTIRSLTSGMCRLGVWGYRAPLKYLKIWQPCWKSVGNSIFCDLFQQLVKSPPPPSKGRYLGTSLTDLYSLYGELTYVADIEQAWTGGGREVEHWKKYADILYGFFLLVCNNYKQNYKLLKYLKNYTKTTGTIPLRQ